MVVDVGSAFFSRAAHLGRKLELLGSDTNFAAVHRTVPSGRAVG